MLERMTDMTNRPGNRSLLPWSHRQHIVVRVLITMLAGAASGVVGTLAHRMGAEYNIPYGLALAFLILGISTWCARARCNAIGIGFHLIASSGVVWGMAMYGPGGDAMIPIGFSAPMPFFVQNAGSIWLYGEILLQVVMLFLPARWFVVPPREERLDDGDVDAAYGGGNGESASPASVSGAVAPGEGPDGSTQVDDRREAPSGDTDSPAPDDGAGIFLGPGR